MAMLPIPMKERNSPSKKYYPPVPKIKYNTVQLPTFKPKVNRDTGAGGTAYVHTTGIVGANRQPPQAERNGPVNLGHWGDANVAPAPAPASTNWGYSGYDNTATSGTSEVAPVKVTWEDKYKLPGAPSWWRGMLPSSYAPDSEYAVMMNTMIPYLSEEDQRQVATNLARLFPDAFGSYSGEKTSFAPAPTNITTDLTRRYGSTERAKQMLSALDTMRSASGRAETDFGPGYAYLRNVADTLQDFGSQGADLQTRQQIIQMYGALDPLLAETKQDNLSAYSEISRAMTQPFFSAGQVIPVSKDANGNWIFGQANKRWY